MFKRKKNKKNKNTENVGSKFEKTKNIWSNLSSKCAACGS